MVAIWRDVLGRADIGVLDDFFDLDGDSMHAIRVIARIRETYGVSVRAIDFFESPTVETLAAFVASQTTPERPVVGPREPDAEPVLSFDQHRLWLADQLVPGGAYNVHGRRRLLGPLRADVLESCIRAIRDRHETLRTRFPDVDGEPLQIVDDPDPGWRLRTADVSGADDPLAAAVRLLDRDATTSLSLAEGPLFLSLLVKLGDSDHVLGITAHHTVCDNGSVAIFVSELSALYRAGGDPARAGLPPLPIQYRDFAVWQRRWLAGAAITRELDYWRAHLAGAPRELTLPAAKPSGAAPATRGGRLRTAMPPGETAALHEVCRTHDVTVFMALLAAYTSVLGRWSGQRDVVVGVPMTGRTDAGTRGLIGLFFNTLPIRVRLDGDPSIAEVLGRSREAALGGYAHPDVPLDLIVRQVSRTRVLNRTPLFQVMLNVVDVARGDTGLGDVDDEPMDSPVLPSKLDFLLTAREMDGSVHLDLEFDADRYDEARARDLIEDMRTLLRAAGTAPGTAVFDQPAAARTAPPAPKETRS